MFTKNRRDCALGLPLKALDELYALPSRDYIERAGGAVRVNAPARVTCAGGATVRGAMVPGATVRVRERSAVREGRHLRSCRGTRFRSVFPDRPAALERCADVRPSPRLRRRSSPSTCGSIDR